MAQPNKNPWQYKQKALDNWLLWRLIIEGGMNHEHVFSMDWDELFEANAALDIHIENVNQSFKSNL